MTKQQSQSGHSIIDMELISLELQPVHSTSRRKAQEVYLIDTGKTLSPDGINRRNEQSLTTDVFSFSIAQAPEEG